MNPEIELLASCIRSRGAFNTTNDLLDRGDWTPLSSRIFDAVREFYSRDSEAEAADWKYVYNYATRGMTSEGQKDMAREVLEQAKGLEISIANVMAYACEVRRQALGMKLAESFCNGDHDEETFQEYTRLIENEDLSKVMGDELKGVGIDELMEVLDEKNKIKMYPASLNERIGGGIVRGDNIVLAARPEAGKSAFLITNMAGMASRGHKVLYCGNEDAVKKIIVRVVSCLTGKKAIDMMQDPQGTMEIARKRGYDNIIFAHPVSTPGHVASLCRRHQPDVVMVDQIRNMKVKADNRVGQLEASGIAMRDIAAEHKVAAIGVTQVGDSGEQKLRLGMSDIDGSKCFSPDTLVRMFDGSSKAIKDVKVGETVMGPDSTPREVLAIGSGNQPMYRIRQTDRKEYTVNEEHIFHLKKTTQKRSYGEQNKVYNKPLRWLLDNPDALKHLKAISSGYEVSCPVKPKFSPYIFGLWLSDGASLKPEISNTDRDLVKVVEDFCEDNGFIATKRTDATGCNYVYMKDPTTRSNRFTQWLRELGVFGNKKVPDEVFCWSNSDRLAFVAGLIDGDGSLSDRPTGVSYELATPETPHKLCEALWSVGLKASITKSRAKKSRIYVSGDLSKIPVVCRRKKTTFCAQKDVLTARIDIEPVGEGQFCGITVDKDNLFLLANGVIAHNTGIQASCDIMILIGVDNAFDAANSRMLNLPKNKTGGGHDAWSVKIDPTISRYYDE